MDLRVVLLTYIHSTASCLARERVAYAMDDLLMGYGMNRICHSWPILPYFLNYE
jgi:hypothetical protein